jgi:hypothetical protein
MSAKRTAREARFTKPMFELDDEPSADILDGETAARIVDGPPDVLPPTAGIDEAGLGPLLGPMTIGYSAFRVPPDVRDLWRALRRACTGDVAKDATRLVVADSKVVFTRDARSARRLERTVLAFVALRERERHWPRDARAMLDRLSRDAPATEIESDGACSFAGGHAPEPWHRHLECALPKHGAREELDALVATLERAATAAKIEIAGAGARIVPVSALNHSFAQTRNKSVTHWRATAPLLARSWNEHAHEGLELVVDRHGGRMRYAALLARTFARATVHIVLETPPSSQYIVLERAPEDAPGDSAVRNDGIARDGSTPIDDAIATRMGARPQLPIELRSSPLEPDSRKIGPHSQPLELHVRPLDGHSHSLDGHSHSLDVDSHPLDIDSHPLDIDSHPLDGHSHPLGLRSQLREAAAPAHETHSHPAVPRSQTLDAGSRTLDGRSPTFDMRAQMLGLGARRGGRVVRHMRITFAERAETISFSAALASCLAKYARETCMDAFNAYFESLQPGLKPTAGYRNDAWRWLEEAVTAIERSGLERSDLVRER